MVWKRKRAQEFPCWTNLALRLSAGGGFAPAGPARSIAPCASLCLVMTRGLTNRWSQPLAVVMRTLNFMKQFNEFATLAVASGGSALSR